MSDRVRPRDRDSSSGGASSSDRDFTVDTARQAAERGELARWVREFLASEGSDNEELGRMLTERERWWIGPVELPIRALHRLVGPPGDPVLVAVADDDWWRDDVHEMAEQIDEEAWEPPPVVVSYRDSHLALEDGNHRVEGLRRSGAEEAWAVVGFESEAERDGFVASAEQIQR